MGDEDTTIEQAGIDDPVVVDPPETTTGRGSGRSRRSLFRMGVGAGAVGMVGAVAGARVVDAAPWLVLPSVRRRNEIGRFEVRRERPVSSEVRWRVETERRMVALTFDDGPDPDITAAVLGALDRHGARATFFVLGALAERHPEVVRDIAARGHEVGNHTWTHPQLLETGIDTTAEEIGLTQGLLTELLGETPRWFRPPRGQVTGEVVGVAANHRLDIALWSQRFGAQEPGDRPRVGALVRAVQPGDIVLAHDGVGEAAEKPGSDSEVHKRTTRTADAAALDELLTRLGAEGWEMVTLTELVGHGRAATV